jgi:hypothetical protein
LKEIDLYLGGYLLCCGDVFVDLGDKRYADAVSIQPLAGRYGIYNVHLDSNQLSLIPELEQTFQGATVRFYVRLIDGNVNYAPAPNVTFFTDDQAILEQVNSSNHGLFLTFLLTPETATQAVVALAETSPNTIRLQLLVVKNGAVVKWNPGTLEEMFFHVFDHVVRTGNPHIVFDYPSMRGSEYHCWLDQYYFVNGDTEVQCPLVGHLRPYDLNYEPLTAECASCTFSGKCFNCRWANYHNTASFVNTGCRDVSEFYEKAMTTVHNIQFFQVLGQMYEKFRQQPEEMLKVYTLLISENRPDQWISVRTVFDELLKEATAQNYTFDFMVSVIETYVKQISDGIAPEHTYLIGRNMFVINEPNLNQLLWYLFFIEYVKIYHGEG